VACRQPEEVSVKKDEQEGAEEEPWYLCKRRVLGLNDTRRYEAFLIS
jgi:hypothetical protein